MEAPRRPKPLWLWMLILLVLLALVWGVIHVLTRVGDVEEAAEADLHVRVEPAPGEPVLMA